MRPMDTDALQESASANGEIQVLDAGQHRLPFQKAQMKQP